MGRYDFLLGLIIGIAFPVLFSVFAKKPVKKVDLYGFNALYLLAYFAAFWLFPTNLPNFINVIVCSIFASFICTSFLRKRGNLAEGSKKKA